MNRVVAALAGLALVGGLVLASSAPTALTPLDGVVRVMPLGDSITDGFGVPGGYRIALWERLLAHGYTVDFVGSASNGPGTLGDRDHEGHTGWRIAELSNNITAWLNAATPTTILLHIGTNDMYSVQAAADAPAQLSALIDKIRAAAPTAELFVAQITPLADPTMEARVQNYNAAIPTILSREDPHTHFVDIHTAIQTTDLEDGIHPNANGYRKMADRWFTALQSIPASLAHTP